MSWARTSNFTLMPNKTVCSSAVGRRKRALPFCIPPRVRNLFRVVPQKVLTLQLVNSWGGGRTRPIGLINGKRERPSFKTKAEADTFAELKKTERQNQGTAALALPQAIKVDAAKASTLLTPHNVSLEEAAKYYLKHVIAYRDAPIISKIVDRMLTEAEKNDRRDRTISELKSRLTIFTEHFPDRRLSELTVEEIKAWIDEDENWSARTRINYLTKISQLFN